MREATLASRNPHKARELEALLPGWQIEPLDGAEYPPETGGSYYENAREKAEFGRRDGRWSLGEDSGLEVAALDGRPGLHSARYAPEGAPAIAKLLAELDGVEERGARYVSELVAISPDGREVRGTGTLEGTIARAPRGTGGFGYDPIFVPDGEERTVAELGDEWKSRNSHRARAARALLAALGAVLALVVSGCGANDSTMRRVLSRFLTHSKDGRAFAARFPHKPGALPCVLHDGDTELQATCSADVSLVKHSRAVITLTEAWDHGAQAHTWFFFIRRDGTVESSVQEGAPAPRPN